jgi:hypothetical protein
MAIDPWRSPINGPRRRFTHGNASKREVAAAFRIKLKNRECQHRWIGVMPGA